MEFGERKRSRKSQSFKLLSAGAQELPSAAHRAAPLHASYRWSILRRRVAAEAPISEPKDATAKPREDWVGEEGMEIKRQITGMMKILSDRSVRGYQRVGLVLSQDSGEDGGQSAPLQLPDHAWASVEGIAPSTLSSTHTNGPGTRSRAQRAVHSTKDLTKTLQVNDSRPPSAEPPCCMCNCKDTLQAILQELQAMRKMMQSEKEKQEPNAVLPSQPVLLGPTPPHRPLKRRPIYKVPPLTVCAARHAPVSPVPACAPVFAPASAPASAPAHSGGTSDAVRPVDTFRALGQSVDAQPDNSDPTSLLHPPSKRLESEPEVRLVEDFDVFISKAQLDSILINYTRSGSLLFRKLVCAFFNDATLANSLPNGKRKRGLNDNRKGLDQNIVGAVKAFTEKYCIEHNIEKLPGPRDWVQILQDQIKLARRRLRRDAAEDKI